MGMAVEWGVWMGEWVGWGFHIRVGFPVRHHPHQPSPNPNYHQLAPSPSPSPQNTKPSYPTPPLLLKPVHSHPQHPHPLFLSRVMPTYMHTYIRTGIHTFIHTYIPSGRAGAFPGTFAKVSKGSGKINALLREFVKVRGRAGTSYKHDTSRLLFELRLSVCACGYLITYTHSWNVGCSGILTYLFQRKLNIMWSLSTS